MTTYDAIDCQAFAGGMTLGVVQAGFRLVGKREMEGGFGVKNCEANRHLLGYDWEAEACKHEDWTPKDVPFVFGNPPCSGFSLLSRSDFRGPDSPINHCMWALTAFAVKCKPEIIAFESVSQAYSGGRSLMTGLREKLVEDTGEHWDLYHLLHNAASVGGAAIRRRYFFVAVRGGRPFGIEPVKVERVPTLMDVIGDLGGMGQTWERQPYRRAPSWWAKPRRHESGAVDGHISRNTPAARRAYDLMRGTHWHEKEIISNVARRYYETHGDLPESWAFQKDKLVANDFKMGFNQLVRWRGDRMARVITGGGLDLVMHPVEDRLLTHREVARIQGFPDDWLIRPLRGVSSLHLTWGKGIPVDCGKWLGGWVKASLDGNPGPYIGEPDGNHERVIDCTDAYRAVSSER